RSGQDSTEIRHQAIACSSVRAFNFARYRLSRNAFMPLLEIRNLKLEFGSGDNVVHAVDDVSLSIEAGETVCLVGESGSGKSVTALSIARLVPSPPARYAGGEIKLDGADVLKMSK